MQQPAQGASTTHMGLGLKFHQTTLEKLKVGKLIIDPGLLASATLASKCVFCRQILIETKKGSKSQISVRKGQLLKGFAISALESRVSGQRKDQAVCLECIKRYIGRVSASDVTVSVATGGNSAETWFERSSPAASWKQQKTLLGQEIVALQAKEEAARGRRSAPSAAEAALNRGRNVREITRKPLSDKVSGDNLHAGDGGGHLSIKAQAAKFISCIRTGETALYSVGEQPSTSTVYLASPWDHNAARPKGFGRPIKGRALLETVYWDTMGKATCSCDRGRLYFEAPCVHKLVLQALEPPRLASHIHLQRGPRVVEAPCERVGERVFGVYWNAGSPSPHRTMVHFGAAEQFTWYCEGRQSGCSKLADCSHIVEVKRALERPDGVYRLVPSSFTDEQLGGAVGALNSGGCSESEMDFELNKFLEELVVGSHPEAICKGESCFCQQNVVFGAPSQGGAASCVAGCCSTQAGTSGKRRRGAGAEGGGAVPLAAGGKRRTKAYWAEREGTGGEEETSGEVGSEERGGADGATGTVEKAGPCFEVPVCTSCRCPASACLHGGLGKVAPVLPMEAEGVQREVPKLVRPTDTWEIHDPLVQALRSPVRVSELTDRDFAELSGAELLTAPCPQGPPPCATKWRGLWQTAHVFSLLWSQEVKVRIFCCTCPDKHCVHFNGEDLGLYAWTRGVIVTQFSCQLLLRSVQTTGSAFSGLVTANNQVRRQYNPRAVILSEESWRKASLGFFKLCGRSIVEACSLCGPHPEVLLCDGIAGLACANGSRQKAGLSGTSAAKMRPFTAPSQDSAGNNVEKVMTAGVNYCAASLAGAGMKRRLVHQPELRALLARYSGHHPNDPELGKALTHTEYAELQVALDRADVQLVSEFVADPDDDNADPVLLHWRRRVQMEQVGQVRSKNQAVFELLDGIEREAMQEEARWPPRCPSRWSELVYSLGSPLQVSDDSNLIQHWRALSVVRKLLLGGVADDGDRVALAEHSPILRRLLDHYGDSFPAFFLPALHHLYRLTLFGRGAVGLGVDRAGWALSAIEGLDLCVRMARDFRLRAAPPSNEQLQIFRFWRKRADSLLPEVERLQPPEQYDLLPAELSILNDRLGLQEDGSDPPPLPPDHPYCREQRALGCYPLPGWEQKRPVPRYRPFEDEFGRSLEKQEEYRCRSGLMVGEFDAEMASRTSSKAAKRLRQHTKGGFVFCCPHRLIVGFHIMLRGESPRDPFIVLYCRLDRRHLPRFLVYDNSCKLQAYSILREPVHFADVRFVVDRFHFQRTTAEAHKCGPSFNPDYYDAIRWVNTSAVESCNSFLVRFRKLAWFSTLAAFVTILINLISGRNSELVRVDDAKLRIAVRAHEWRPAVRQRLLTL